MLKFKNSFQNRTSSLVSTDPSTLGLALLARRGAVMLEKHRVLSGGGPPRGWPRITTASPDSTCKRDIKCKCTCVTCFHNVVYFSRSIRLPLVVLVWVMCHFYSFILTATKLLFFFRLMKNSAVEVLGYWQVCFLAFIQLESFLIYHNGWLQTWYIWWLWRIHVAHRWKWCRHISGPWWFTNLI